MVERMRMDGSLPQGTVTFICTDIAESTRLLERLGRDLYGEVLLAHRELLRGAIADAGGVEVDSHGDSLFAAFGGAGDAVRGAVASQRAVAAHQWPAGAQLRVRMGVHTGEASVTEEGYVGMAVYRGRRVCEAAHGGQIVASSATHAIVAADAPPCIAFRDLGEVSLAGFDQLERLYQIVAESLPDDFPDLRAARTWPEARPLLERAEELAALNAAITASHGADGRVVVIEGPPGIGKSSLLAEARARAAASGLAVVQARGSELESAFSFGVVRQLFEPILAKDDLERAVTLLDGAAAHAARLFHAEIEIEQANEDVAFALLHGLYWLTLNLAESQPLVVAVDDLQWADAPSLRWLSYLARRMEGQAVCVIATMRPVADENPLLADLLLDPAVAILQPRALSVSSVAELVRTELAAEADEDFCLACHRATGGNPLLLRELLRALAAEDVLPIAASAPIVERLAPDAVARSVRLRLSRLSPEAERLARAVAILGDGETSEHAAAVAELERGQIVAAAMLLPTPAVLALLGSGLATHSDTLLMLEHVVMLPSMLVAMLLRRGEYSGHRHQHAQVAA
jgi:class 3 adenylate cyclase